MKLKHILTLSLLIISSQITYASETLNNNEININFKTAINEVINELENTTPINNDDQIRNKEMIEEFNQFVNNEELLKEASADHLNEFIKRETYNDKLQYLKDFENATNELNLLRKEMISSQNNINNINEEEDKKEINSNFNPHNKNNIKNINEEEISNKSLNKNDNDINFLSDLEKDLGMKDSFKSLNKQLLGTNVIQEMYVIADNVYGILSNTNNLNMIINSNVSDEVYNNIIEIIDNIENKLWQICRIPLGCKEIIATHFIPCLEMDFDVIDYLQTKSANRTYFRDKFSEYANFMINKDQNCFNEVKQNSKNVCNFIANKLREVNGSKEKCLSKIRHSLIDMNVHCLDYFIIDHNFFNYKWNDYFKKNATAICEELLDRISNNTRDPIYSLSNFIINILLDSDNLQIILDRDDKHLFYIIQDIFEKFSNIEEEGKVYDKLAHKICEIILSNTVKYHGKPPLFNDDKEDKEEYNNLTEYCYNKIVEVRNKVEQAFNKIIEESKGILDKNAFENPIKYINKSFNNILEKIKRDPMAYCLAMQESDTYFIEYVGNRKIYHV